MKQYAGLAAIVALMSTATPAMASPPKGEAGSHARGVTLLSADDATMNAAIAEAPATLSEFLDRLDAGQLSEHDLLKVEFLTLGGGGEHIWVANVRRSSDGFSGVLANDPVDLGLRRGDPVRFSEAMVSDWSYEAHGRLWGNFTTRAVLPRRPSDQAAQLRAVLSETPVEP